MVPAASEHLIYSSAAWRQALHYYAGEPGPHAAKAKEVYGKLRSNVLNNIVRQYNTTGYLWENYDDETGRGKGSHPFTGCGSCIYCSPSTPVQSLCMHLLGLKAPQIGKHAWHRSLNTEQSNLCHGSFHLGVRATALLRCGVLVDCRWTALFVLVAGETYD